MWRARRSVYCSAVLTTTTASVDPSRVHAALRAIEGAFSAGVLHPDVLAALQVIGAPVETVEEVTVVTRSAAMRTDNPSVVWSAFFNFNPVTIDRLIPATWRRVSFDDVLTAQTNAMDPVFRAALTPMAADELAELAALCRTATVAAIERCEGRPLCAGIASLPLPDAEHLMVWHAACLLREHRGDGHVAALVVEGLGRVEALVVHAAMQPRFQEVLRRSRRWRREDWQDAMASLRRKGWLTDDDTPTFTPAGRERRQWIEDRTDELAASAYESIGDDGVERMIALGARYTAALDAAGLGRELLARVPIGE